MAAAAQFPDEFPDEELLRLGRGVCMIKTKVGTGTGFHYGGGWIMSNAHVFQDVQDDKTMRSIISSATFTFLKGEMVEDNNNVKIIRSTKKNHVVFESHKRTAFIHRILVDPDHNADFTNMDIAMIKLGKQCEEGRPEKDIIYRWEEEEDELLSKQQEPKVVEVKLKKDYQLSAFAQLPPPEPKKGDKVYGIHFAGSDYNKKFVRSKITKITQATNNAVPMLHYNNSKDAFSPGSSGCPVMIYWDSKYWLAGLNFAGDRKTAGNDDNREQYALRWTGGIQKHIGNEGGVSIIIAIETYLAQKDDGNKMGDEVSKAREKRCQVAKANRLPMYDELHDPLLESIEKNIQEAEDNKLKDHKNNILKPEQEGLEKIARKNQLTIYLANGEIYPNTVAA